MLVTTKGVNIAMARNAPFARFVLKCVGRFNSGDWGDTSKPDADMNDRAIKAKSEERVMATYKVPAELHEEPKLWISREVAEYTPEGDPVTVTTVLFPHEY